ncbi:hypothetical protein O4H52_14785 [Sphingomonadaceae bacterium G21617-S1]|nr:hypothetical protein [Sphingomonadaceae bacterium G21617-S1]
MPRVARLSWLALKIALQGFGLLLGLLLIALGSMIGGVVLAGPLLVLNPNPGTVYTILVGFAGALGYLGMATLLLGRLYTPLGLKIAQRAVPLRSWLGAKGRQAVALIPNGVKTGADSAVGATFAALELTFLGLWALAKIGIAIAIFCGVLWLGYLLITGIGALPVSLAVVLGACIIAFAIASRR